MRGKVVLIPALSLVFLIQSLPALGETGAADYFSMSFEELLSVEIISASRSLTSIADAPSVVSVITAEEISRQGLKTLEEVLQRIPGFFTSQGTTRAIVSNRGVLTNKFLLLFDGHSVNSIVKNGMFQQYIFPLLDNIERIEIVRGPGSTLWGSEAALGVINIITRESWADTDAEDAPHGKLDAVYDYAGTIDRHIAKLSYDKALGEQSGLALSVNWFTSDPEWLNRFVPKSYGFAIQRGGPDVVRDFDDSWELYGKLKLDSFQLTGRATSFISMTPQFTNLGSPERSGHYDYRNNFIEAKYRIEIDTESSLELRGYFDYIRDHAVGDTGGGRPTRYIRSEEDRFGGELIYTSGHFSGHEIKSGLLYQYVDVRRLHEQRFLDGVLVAEGDLAQPGTDTTVALFAEDTWHFAEKWIAVLGGRLDKNDFREKKTIFLPRAGLIYSPTDRVTLKYLYNTGYIRPYVQQNHGTAGEPFYNSITGDYWVGAKNSEQVESHDIQLLYNHEKIYFGATLYHLTYDDFIEWVGVAYQTNPTYRVYFQNIGDVTSKGVELEFKAELAASLAVYGNYSYTKARLGSMQYTLPVGVPIDLTGKPFVEPGGAFTGAPEHIWHLGVDYNIASDVDLNIHYRGWNGAWALESHAPTYKKFGPEHYFDLNLRWKNIFKGSLDLSFYCKNLFDNTGTDLPPVLSGPPVPVTGNVTGQPTPAGVFPGVGRVLGVQLVAEF